MLYENDKREIMQERVALWNGMGKPIAYASNAEQAMELGGLNFTVEKRVLKTADNNGVDRAIHNVYSTVRTDTDEVLGVGVSNKFTLVQNADAFAFTDAIVSGEMGHEVHYETAGVLRGGAIAWVSASLPETNILGDAYHPYIVFANGHDGKSAVNVITTNVRVVCQNTLNLALKTGDRVFSMKHHSNVKERLQDAQRVLQNFEAYQNKFALEADRLAMYKLSAEDEKACLDKLFPQTEDMGDTAQHNSELLRYAFLECYNAYDIRQFKHTAWGFINAMSDLAYHSALRKPNPQKSDYAKRVLKAKENRFMNLWKGNQLLDSTYELFA